MSLTKVYISRKSVLDYEWAVRRMLQALDAYWLHCDGFYRPGDPKHRPRGKYEAEDWWGRFEKYRKLVEGK